MASQYDIHIRTDLDRPLMKYSFSGAMFSKDNKAHLIDVTTYKNNQMVPIIGTIEGIVRRNDGKKIGFEGSIVNGVACIELPDAAYESDGPITILIRNRENAYSAVIGYISAYVSDTGDPEYGTGGTYVISISEIQEKLNEIDPLIVRLQTLNVEDLSDLTDYLEDISDVLAELETLDEDLTEAITEARDLAYSKVNRPEENPDGTSGQLLRTNGDGTTEWADVGTPTDAQATSAVNAYLAAHPEIITTVDDNEITEAKLHPDVRAKVEAADLIGSCALEWESGAMVSGTGIEYAKADTIRTKFFPVTPGGFYLFNWTLEQPLNIYLFASNTTTASGVNERLKYKSTGYAKQPFGYTIPDGAHYIRLQIDGTVADQKPTMISVSESALLKGVLSLGSAEAIIAENKHHYFSDANDAPVNKAYYIRASAEIANTPYGNGMSSASIDYTGGVREVTGYLNGVLYTFQAGEMTNQIFISTSRTVADSSEPSTLYYRSKYSESGWSNWHKLNDKAQLTASNIAIRKKMIAPYLDGTTPTATDTNVPNPQYMGDDPLIFNDFNDAPLQSIYQIDLDCDTTVMANNPMPGKSSVLVTMGFSYVSQHGKIQLCVGLDYPDAFAYVRYGYQNTSTEYIWTDWANLVKTFGMEGRIENGTDLNTVKTSGIYLLGTNGNYGNAPTDLTYGFLTVKTINVITCQTVETSSATYTRMFNGSSWTGWR